MSRLPDLTHEREIDRWIAWVRLLAVPVALLELVFERFPADYRTAAWVSVGALAVGAVVLFWQSRRELSEAALRRTGFAALAFDAVIVSAFVVLYSFEAGTPVRQLLFLPVIEAALRFGLLGGALLPLLHAPALAVWEQQYAGRAGVDFDPGHVLGPMGLQILVGLTTGLLIGGLRTETGVARARAAEAEGLRDQLGRRADQLEAVNRCARALSSTLEQDEAFHRFLRELSGVFQFDRLAIVLAEGPNAEVMANAGRDEDTLFPKGTARPIAGSILEHVLADAHTVVRPDMAAEQLYPEERQLADVGLRSRVVAPLNLGGSILGMLSVSREQPDAFSRDEVDLVTLLARQVASAVQNIRTYAAERSAAEELRRLSALRADFVSLVSHELRAPMASVIGCATTLRERWRELQPEQRESFLALIEEETGRLSNLIGDVLDTSRIEAGTFSYVFGKVDLGELVRETAAMVTLGHDEISVSTSVRAPLPPVRGDRERLRQLLLNLLTNAAKYTHAGDEIEVSAEAADGVVLVGVSDHGPGIPPDQQRLVFEKFGRVNLGAKSKPGAGLGLFIARSIAEAHGGSLEVSSQTASGATFTLRLPVSAP